MKKTQFLALLSPMILSLMLSGCYQGASLTEEERIQLEQKELQKQKMVSQSAITTPSSIVTPTSQSISENNLIISKALLWNWQKHFYSNTDLYNEKVKQEILEALKNSYLNDIFIEYPSEEQGFSSKNEDVNTEFYVSMTKEDAIVRLGSQIERIINPLYGEWLYFQYPQQDMSLEDKYKRIYEGLASEEYLQYLIDNQDIEGVIYIDKDNENYRTFPSSNNINVRFTGIIKKVEILSTNSNNIQLGLKINYVDAKNKLKTFETRKMIVTFEKVDDTFLIKNGYFEY